MVQSKEAKLGWRNAPRLDQTIFPFRDFPPLVEFISRVLPEDTHVALVGGGKGHLAGLLHNGKRTFVTIDIANVTDPIVPLVVADFEQPLPNVRKSNVELTALAAFSLEYADVPIATANIAKLLVAGERFLFICHHSDSPYLISMRFDRQLLEFINIALMGIRSASREEWLWRCRGLETEIRKMFSGKEGSMEFPNFGLI